MDGIFYILKNGFTEELFHHLNGARLTIKFTMEQKEELRTLSFTLLRRRDGSSLDIFVYRKPMHMNRYLNFGTYDTTHVKGGMVTCLHNRAKVIIIRLDNDWKKTKTKRTGNWWQSPTCMAGIKCQVSLHKVWHQSSLLIQAHFLFNVDEGQGYTNVAP